MLAGFLVFVAISLISFLFYKWATQNNDYFERRNVKYLKPTFLIGNIGGMFIRTATEFAQTMYQAFPDES